MHKKPREVAKFAIYAELARVGKAVANPHRILLLDLLLQGPRTVEVLAREAGLTVATTSQHLQRLKSGRLVEAQRQGTFVRYALADGVDGFVLHLRDLGRARLATVEQARAAYAGPPSKDRAALLARCRVGEATILDVRPEAEYLAGHLTGAIHAPLEHLDAIADRLADDRQIVTYCRGAYCRYAMEAAKRLRARGFMAVHLDVGVPELRRLGFPIDGSAAA